MKARGIIGMLLCGFSLCAAQNTAVYRQPERDFDMGVTLYQNAKYAPAKRAFTAVERRLEREDNRYMRSECMYYKAMCDVFLYRKSGATALRDFVETFPESNRVNDAYLQLANFEYDYKRYRSALDYFMMVDAENVDNSREERDRYFFRAGYSAFQIKDYDNAKTYLSRLMDRETRYTVFATYYYAYILYTQGYYQSALETFDKIKDDASLNKIVPLYMLQCYHVLGDHKKVLELGPELLETAGEKRTAEISRMMGEAFYKEENYEQAAAYMRNFYQNSSSLPDAGGRYILAYSYYKMSYFDSAAVFFQEVANMEPEAELKQSALYHLAYCYIQQGKKKFAMDAFAQAAGIEANPTIAEDAAYHQAQLACEMGFMSYAASIKVLEAFLERYPASPYSKRIYSYLVSMYLTTKDYDKALSSIEKLPAKSPELKVAEQRLLFNKGVESYLRRAYGTALDFFGRCAASAYDDALTAKALFWQGECCSAGRQYAKAQEFYQKFLSAPASKSLPEYSQGLFAMAYAAMECVNYPLSLRYWKEFADRSDAGRNKALLAESFARQGDCLYMLEEYNAAIDAYEKAGDEGYAPQDYLWMQRALCQGAIGKYEQKVQTLLDMEKNFPVTSLKAKIWQELGSTYLMLDNSERALAYYRKLRDLQPASPAALAAATKMGLIYFNQGKNAEALNCFKAVAQANPSSEEGRQALLSIRNIYMGMNQIDKYFAYVKQLPHINVEESEQDSLTYMSAENFYLDGEYAQALAGFKKYTDTYPEGIFTVDAWKNAAVCAERTGDVENMKAAYAKLSQMKIVEAESSAAKLADLYYAEKDYKPALGYYIRLAELASDDENKCKATLGKMRCYRALGRTKDLIGAALEVLRLDGVTEMEIDEARYFIAQSAPAVGEKELAMQQYEILARSKNPDYASEALYVLLEQRYKGGFLEEAERMIVEYLGSYSLNDYYLAKVYLLWADIYFQRGNVLQAKQTLQSIVDNYEGEDLKSIAKEKLEMIAQKEAQEMQAEEEIRSERYADEDYILPTM